MNRDAELKRELQIKFRTFFKECNETQNDFSSEAAFLDAVIIPTMSALSAYIAPLGEEFIEHVLNNLRECHYHLEDTVLM